MRPAVFSETWRVRSASLETEDFFAQVGEIPCALLHGDGRWIIHGEDPLWSLDEPELDGIIIERAGEHPPILPDFIGFIGYEYGRHLEPWMPAPLPAPFAIPEFHFALHRRLRLFDRATGLLYEALREGPRRSMATSNLLRKGTFSARKIEDTETLESYGAKVERIREEIAAGNVYQVNLTRQEHWTFEGNLTEFARRLGLADPAPCSAFIAGPGFTVVSASPEAFLRIQDGRLCTRPIKGTAPRDAAPALDEALKQGLLASSKNRSELAMITDLLRNDLSRVCRAPSVRVDAFAALESFARVHHLVSTVSGELAAGLSLKDILRATFPGGSITGCPKLAAMALIRELEGQPRGVYTGALGWFSHDLSQLDLSIAIRTAFATERDLWFGVGGGIVWDSEPQDEYMETIHKGESLVRCLS